MPRDLDAMSTFIARVLVEEGCWIVEPRNHSDNYLLDLYSRLRTIPARIWSPTGKDTYEFARPGSRGHWVFVWVPEQK